MKVTPSQLEALRQAYCKIDGKEGPEPATRPLKACVTKGLIAFSPTGFAVKTPAGQALIKG